MSTESLESPERVSPKNRISRLPLHFFVASLTLGAPVIAAESPSPERGGISSFNATIAQSIPGKPGLPVNLVLSPDGKQAAVFLGPRDQSNPGQNKRTWVQNLNLATREWGPPRYVDNTANGEAIASCADGSLIWQAWFNGKGYLYRLTKENTAVLTQEPTPTTETISLTAGCDLRTAFFVESPKHAIGKPSNDPDRIVRRDLISGATSVVLADHVYAQLLLDPAGQHLAFGKADGLWMVNTDGTQAKKIASKPPVTNEFVQPASWSPDGSLVAYRIIWGGVDSIIFIARADGPELPVRVLLKGVKNVWSVAWHPDGDKLVIAADDQLTVMKLEGPMIDDLVARLAARSSAPQVKP
jgi:hypothetical protein